MTHNKNTFSVITICICCTYVFGMVLAWFWLIVIATNNRKRSYKMNFLVNRIREGCNFHQQGDFFSEIVESLCLPFCLIKTGASPLILAPITITPVSLSNPSISAKI